MLMTQVKSSNIAAVGYRPQDHILRVEFRGGATYEYYDVPADIYEGLISAGSAGTYFTENVRNIFQYAKV